MIPYLDSERILQICFTFCSEAAMENRRFTFMDRRQDCVMPRVPFKDSKGITIKADRRKIPSRRFDDRYVGWTNNYTR
jgi:hypothetical protein